MRRFICPFSWVGPLFCRGLHTNENTRNVAIIAHVDHGKTTLVDSMLSQSGTVANAHNRVMDTKDQERERGITILAKNTAVLLTQTDPNAAKRINIVDTPGHLDFSGEVERALQLVEGFILLVDAKEGIRPGTRYVLRKALALNLTPIVCINKIDKDNSCIEKTENDIQDLFLDCATNDSQLDLCFMYGSGRSGYMNQTPEKGGSLDPLFRTIFQIVPPPKAEDGQELQILVAQIDVQKAGGEKIAIGRIFQGAVHVGDVVTVALEDRQVNALVNKIELYRGVHTDSVASASFGDICAITLQEPIQQKIPLQIGSTIGSEGKVKLFPYQKPDEPTYSLILQESEAPWKGKECDEGLSRIHFLQKRLEREALVNTALQLSGLGTSQITMRGRGPLHLSVIIEDMRREGYEFEIQAPQIITKLVNGAECEPYERLTLEFKEDLISPIVSFLSMRMAEIGEIEPVSGGRVVLECVMPVRLMARLPLKFHTMTSGDGVLNHNFDSYKPLAAGENARETGALISVENGDVTDWALSGVSSQGNFFVLPGDHVYYGQIIGENTKTLLQNLGLNVCKHNEQLGGMRANSVDKLKSRRSGYQAVRYTFEESASWVTDDELITVTPKSIRMRKPNFTGKTTMRSLKRK
ncbi:unnamed protein product [Phytomonas sp. Hart1]|nr:unnamed protein product [Phytomonas sp. Hart1]|eukprot:CCW70840.1 unnamed protein product [Phytomonas sp. isolate Hart1]